LLRPPRTATVTSISAPWQERGRMPLPTPGRTKYGRPARSVRSSYHRRLTWRVRLRLALHVNRVLPLRVTSVHHLRPPIGRSISRPLGRVVPACSSYHPAGKDGWSSFHESSPEARDLPEQVGTVGLPPV